MECVEKEAFPIIESVDKLRHFLLIDDHFRLSTDHSNLIYLFDPAYKESDFKKQTVDKLCRCAAKLQGLDTRSNICEGSRTSGLTCCLDGVLEISHVLWP
jgi:hypothetical protein